MSFAKLPSDPPMILGLSTLNAVATQLPKLGKVFTQEVVSLTSAGNDTITIIVSVTGSIRYCSSCSSIKCPWRRKRSEAQAAGASCLNRTSLIKTDQLENFKKVPAPNKAHLGNLNLNRL